MCRERQKLWQLTFMFVYFLKIMWLCNSFRFRKVSSLLHDCYNLIAIISLRWQLILNSLSCSFKGFPSCNENKVIYRRMKVYLDVYDSPRQMIRALSIPVQQSLFVPVVIFDIKFDWFNNSLPTFMSYTPGPSVYGKCRLMSCQGTLLLW